MRGVRLVVNVVGKHVEEMARQAEAAEAATEEIIEEAEDEAEAPALAEVEETAPVEVAFAEPVFEPEEDAPMPRRRMRFEFEQPAMERQ